MMWPKVFALDMRNVNFLSMQKKKKKTLKNVLGFIQEVG
jgi:hypothetical protein